MGIIVIISIVVYLLAMIVVFVINAKFTEYGELRNPEQLFIPHPGHLRKVRKVNWFGAILLYILYIIFWFPIWFFVFFHYLFTVGRED